MVTAAPRMSTRASWDLVRSGSPHQGKSYVSLVRRSPAAGSAHAADPPPARVTLPALRGADGKAVNAFASRDTKAVVVAVLSFKCPVARDSVEPLSELARVYGPKGVTVIGVVPNESPEAVARAASKAQGRLPGVFADRQLAVADALEPRSTLPGRYSSLDADPRRALSRAGGRQVWRAAEAERPDHWNHLRERFDELLAGKPVSVPRPGASAARSLVREEAAKQRGAGHVLQGRAADLAEPLPGVPSAR